MPGKQKVRRKVKEKTLLCCLIMTATFLYFSAGCEESYKGTSLERPARKVAIYDIEGPGGDDFTGKLGAEINALGKVVVYGSQYGEPVDSITAAKIARDNGAEVFILGKITQSGIVNEGDYVIRGSFSLHDAANGDQIGGIPDAHYKENINVFLGINRTMAGLGDAVIGIIDDSSPNQTKQQKEFENQVKEKEPDIRQKLAREVAIGLSKGLGR